MDEKQPNKEHNRVFTNSQRGGGRHSRRGHGHHRGHRRDQQIPSAPPTESTNFADESCTPDESLPSAPPQEKCDDKSITFEKDEPSQKHRGRHHHHHRHQKYDNYPNAANAFEPEGCGEIENRPPEHHEQRRPYRPHRKHGHRERHPRDGGYQDSKEEDLEKVKHGDPESEDLEKLKHGDSKREDQSAENQHDSNIDTSLRFRSYNTSGYKGYHVYDRPSYSNQDCRSQQPRSFSAYQRRDWGQEGLFRQLGDGAEACDDSSIAQAHQRNFKQGYRGSRSYKNKENDDSSSHRSGEFKGHRDFKKRDKGRNGEPKLRGHYRRNQNGTVEGESGDEEDDETQRARQTEQLVKGEYECIVCCDLVRRRDPIWCCSNCYHIFHLNCIRKWARSPTASAGEIGWRCPTCQSVTTNIPTHYYCFCGKTRDPERNRYDTPHSCGNTCDKVRPPQENCKHLCNILCHPGPCPPCSASVFRTCPCGRVSLQVLCSRTASLACGEPCKKTLSCGVHTCPETCHDGPCPPCSESVERACYCSKVRQSEACTAESNSNPNFTCGQRCDRILACEQHECLETCHSGDCPPCPTLPELISTCPCGRTPLVDLCGENVRQKCTDPIPTCVALCGKQLPCGPSEERHTCAVRCHHGACPPCPLRTSLKCCCGSSTREVPCTELPTLGVLRCEKRCSKKRQCGRHKCVNTCCVDAEHPCDLVCNQKLSCGLHTCQETCHNGNCRPCWNVSFDELTCHCGAAVIYPPIPCGTKPPECQEKCGRSHACDHPVFHNCHSEETCPPCTNLTSKWCYGGHELRKTIPCYQEGFSCGLTCNKPLACGQHQCQLTCHQGPCQKECLQPCTKPREDCTHICGAPCHEGSCPENVPCKAIVTMTCICGTRSERLTCGDSSRSFQKMSASLLASKMQDIQSGNSVDISDILGSGKKNKLHRLECNDDCALVERNRRLALALQIKNPDLAGKPGPPNYSDFLKDEARKNPQFVDSIYEKLSDLVQLAKQSKQKSRSHSFPPMNRDQRKVIHELSDFFGCETESYDQEPKRNVVATAFRDKGYLPSVSVIAVIQREMGQRKAPNPALLGSANKPETQAKAIDYFDFSADPKPPAEG